jgi:hypothetical protein
MPRHSAEHRDARAIVDLVRRRTCRLQRWQRARVTVLACKAWVLSMASSSMRFIRHAPRSTGYMKSALEPRTLRGKNRRVYDADVKTCGNRRLADKALTWGAYCSVGIAQGLIRVGGNTMCRMNPPKLVNQDSNVVFVCDVRISPREEGS